MLDNFLVIIIEQLKKNIPYIKAYMSIILLLIINKVNKQHKELLMNSVNTIIMFLEN